MRSVRINIWLLLLVPLFVGAFSVQSEEARETLARQIETASVTESKAFGDKPGVGWTLYPPLLIAPTYRHEMQVAECTVTARTVEIDAQTSAERPIVEIAFDLARTWVPEPSMAVSDKYVFAKIGEVGAQYNIAVFELHFVPPYQPTMVSNTSGTAIAEPVALTRFWMEQLPDETQPRRLLGLLAKYQAEYCTFSR